MPSSGGIRATALAARVDRECEIAPHPESEPPFGQGAGAEHVIQRRRYGGDSEYDEHPRRQ